MNSTRIPGTGPEDCLVNSFARGVGDGNCWIVPQAVVQTRKRSHMQQRKGSFKVVGSHPGGGRRSSRVGLWVKYGRLISAVMICGLMGACAVAYRSRELAQSVGTAGTIEGTITDSNNAAVVGAEATLDNSVTQYHKSTTTDETGSFRFDNVPQNNYTLSVSAKGFGMVQQVVYVRSSVPQSLKILVQPAGAQANVTVKPGSEAVENVPSAHTDVPENLMNLLPSAPGAGLNDLISSLSANVVRDSNTFFHPLGDHAQTSYFIDGEQISDQRSKAFSTQLPVGALQSLEIITGAAPAWAGEKSSLIVNITTKSGLDLKHPVGSLNSSYGTFGTFQEEATFGIGGQGVGNFTAFDFERSGRFLDPPEFSVIHDRGISTGLFNRFDFNPTSRDALHLNIFLARNNFQIPNQFDQEALGQDQHQLVRTGSASGGWVHTFNASTLLTVSPSYRLEQIWYFPSPNPFSDQTQTISQQRRLTNARISADLAYNKGIHNIRVGVQASHTFLTEAFQFGITDAGFNDPASPNFLPGLMPFDLTRGGHLFTFNGHTDIKQEAVYAQDLITVRNLSLSLGLRFDNYNGIVQDDGVQPRVGVSYLIKQTNTVLRGSYTRTFETPYNENLILSSSTGAGGWRQTGCWINRPATSRSGQASATSITRVSSRVLGDTLWWTPTISGSTPTTRTTSTQF
jgi:hypothetical protein